MKTNYRIIETRSEMPDVLLYRDRDEEANEMVQIMAIGTMDDTDDQFAIETVTLPNAEAAKCFINDFTVKSAEAFCNRFGIDYEDEFNSPHRQEK